MKKIGLSVLCWVFFCCGVSFPVMASDTPSVTVFAAASTTDALTEIGQLFSERKMGQMIPSFASSSTLAKQIESGAPADIFISADLKWMDYLVEKKAVAPADRIDLLGNRLVLIAAKTSPIETVDVVPGFALADLLKEERLSVGDPDHVPVGIYAKQALESLGVWDGVKDKLAREKDVRAALVRVARGEVPLGVVYATDAAISDQVKVVGTFPETSHPPIIYPAAVIKGHQSKTVQAFFDLLKGPEGRKIFEKYGFTVR